MIVMIFTSFLSAVMSPQIGEIILLYNAMVSEVERYKWFSFEVSFIYWKQKNKHENYSHNTVCLLAPCHDKKVSCLLLEVASQAASKPSLAASS